MRDDLLLQQVKEALRRAHEEMTPDEWFAMMVREGVIDKNGRVLRRMPEPPEVLAANGPPAPGRKSSRKSANRRNRPGKPPTRPR